MKKIFFAIAAAFCTVCASAQNETTMQDILKKGQEICEVLEDSKDQEIVHIEYDILRDEKSTTRVLTKDYTYRIIAFGDRRFKDIDIVVYKWSESLENWVQVAKDNDESDTAMVTVSPQSDARYKVQIKAYEFNSGYSAGHYGLFICHD